VVVVDNATGLMWHQNGSDHNYRLWDEVKEWIRKLNKGGYAGYHDWRLPTVDEAASLMEPKKNVGKWGDYCIDPVFNKKQSCTWTGDRHSSGTGWAVNFYNSGGVQWSDFTFYYVRPVRSVESW
jgi:serine/threonine-protein kinase